MTLVPITRTTKRGPEEKKRDDTVDRPSFCFSLSSFPPFSLLFLRCNLLSLLTIKGETGRPMQGIAKQAGYDPLQAKKHTQPTETWESIPLSTVCNLYNKLKCK
jgi:hypothetical protein